MKLGDLAKWIKDKQEVWTDDTEVYVNLDAPYMYSITEAYEDEDNDCLVLATHPFQEVIK